MIAPRSWSRPLVLLSVGLIVLPSMLGARGGCKRECGCRKDCDTDTDTDTDGGLGDVSLQRVLQISRVIPDQIAPQTGFTAEILGAGLQDRATVSVGPYEGTNVSAVSDSRLSVDLPPLPEGFYDLTVTNPDGESVTLRRALTVQQITDTMRCDTLTVRFDYNQDGLTQAARAAIDPLVACYQNQRGVIRLEGHADERGTTDYNLALGQRRADSVHRYLVSGGVPVSRLRTVSYGEERPADRGHNEAAWAANRRVEILVEN